MQLYAGLPIITNKITRDEQHGIPHHLLGCIELHEQPWVVGTFVRKASQVIEEIRSRGRLPILVGGTHYYTQSLLFRDRLAQADEAKAKVPEFVNNTADEWPILQEPTSVLLDELRQVDPVMADRWHPNDRRKIQRSLEIFLQTGRPASEIYAEQRQRREDANGQADDAPTGSDSELRVPTLLLWVHAETEALRTRLDQRVDKMLASGLLEEVETLMDCADSLMTSGEPLDETRGIWVSIGYKEFKPYAAALRAGSDNTKQLAALKAEAVERTKIATRQYAKSQLRWIRIKLAHALIQAGYMDNLYVLDGSDVATFGSSVVSPALDLTERFLRADDMPPPTSMNPAAAAMLVPKRDYDLSATPEKWAKQHCEICNVTCVTPDQWLQHTKSKAHRKLVGKAQLADDRGNAG